MCAIALLLWLPALSLLYHPGGSSIRRNLFPGGPALDDLYTYHPRIALLGTALFYRPAEMPPVFAYPPASAYLFKLLYAFHHETVLFLTGCLAFVLEVAGLLFFLLPRRKLTTSNRLLLACSSFLFMFPVLFTAERGNIELVIAFFTLTAIVLVWKGRNVGAALLFGVAASLKPFPLLFAGVFLARRSNGKALLVNLATVACLTLLSLWSAGPSIPAAMKGFAFGITNIEKSRAGTAFQGGLMFDHSLFSPAKLALVSAHITVRPWLDTYYVVAAALLVIGAWRASHLSMLNRIGFYTVMVVALSPISYEYTLLNAYGLLILLTVALWSGRLAAPARRSVWWALLLLLTAMLPFSVDRLGGVAFGGQLVAVLMLILTFVTLRCPWTFSTHVEAPSILRSRIVHAADSL